MSKVGEWFVSLLVSLALMAGLGVAVTICLIRLIVAVVAWFVTEPLRWVGLVPEDK